MTAEPNYSLLRGSQQRPLSSALAQRFASTEPRNPGRATLDRLYEALPAEEQSLCRAELHSILMPDEPQTQDVLDLKPCDPRTCRTHALVAELFADKARTRDATNTWDYLARSWTDLAVLKQSNAETKVMIGEFRSKLNLEMEGLKKSVT
jgi:hypothetical protein